MDPAGVDVVGGVLVGVVGGVLVGVVGGVLVGVVGGVLVGVDVGVEPGVCDSWTAIEGSHEFGTVAGGLGGSTPSTCDGTDCEGPGIGPYGTSTEGVDDGPRPPWRDGRRQGLGDPESSGPELCGPGLTRCLPVPCGWPGPVDCPPGVFDEE